jgi:hypothetical protein
MVQPDFLIKPKFEMAKWQMQKHFAQLPFKVTQAKFIP